MSADDQQGSLPTCRNDPSETTRRTPSLKECKAYLLGAAHDGTYSTKHKTFRFSQKSYLWLIVLKYLLELLGCKSWIYREGKERNVYVLETTAKFLSHECKCDFLSKEEKVAYIRGYFDSEGGVPHAIQDRFYIQICQKNYSELKYLKELLESLKVHCGKIHNPSKRVDSHYWRFYVLSDSHDKFMNEISSWHPLKNSIFTARMKI